MTGQLFIQCAVAFAAVMAFAILFHAPRREWVPCGLTGMMGWMVYWLAVQGGLSVVAASFWGTLGLALLSRVRGVHPVMVSMVGGVAHNVGQVALAMVILSTPSLMYYMAVLMVAGLITGAVTGVAANLVMKHLAKIRR